MKFDRNLEDLVKKLVSINLEQFWKILGTFLKSSLEKMFRNFQLKFLKTDENFREIFKNFQEIIRELKVHFDDVR